MERLLTYKDASSLLGISESTLRHAVSERGKHAPLSAEGPRAQPVSISPTNVAWDGFHFFPSFRVFCSYEHFHPTII